MQAASRSQKEQGSRFSPAARKEHSSASTLAITQWDLYGTSDPQSYCIIHLCYFKPLHLWNVLQHSRKLTWSDLGDLPPNSKIKDRKHLSPPTPVEGGGGGGRPGLLIRNFEGTIIHIGMVCYDPFTACGEILPAHPCLYLFFLFFFLIEIQLLYLFFPFGCLMP